VTGESRTVQMNKRKSEILGTHISSLYRTLYSKLMEVRKNKVSIKRLQSMRKVFGAEILKDLKRLGLLNGDVVYVHSSLKSIGFVQGGADTVLNALIKAVGSKGTLILPSFSFFGSMVETVTSHRIFDPQTTPCSIGLIPETFRKRQGVFRSIHPSHSVCAYGAKAEWITKEHHRCATTFGKGTPYWKMKLLNGKVIGLGVDIRFISFYHTLEDITSNFPADVYHDKEYNIPVLDENGRKTIMKIKPHSSRPIIIVDKTQQGEQLRRYVRDYFVNRNVLHFGKVGEADCWIISIKDFLKCLKELMQKGITIYSTEEDLFFGLKLDKLVKNRNNPILPKRFGKWDAYSIRDFALLISEDNQVVKDSDGKIPAYYCGKATSKGAMKIGFAKILDNGSIVNRLDHAIIEPSRKSGSWYKTQVAQPSVIKRSDGLLMMMAQGWNENVTSLGVFTSDGKCWVDQGRKLTLNQFQDENDNTIVEIGVPCIIKRATKDFFLVFEGRYGINGWRIYAATSSSFIGSWKPYNNGYPILTPSGLGWEAIGVANPKLLEVEDCKFLMAYNGIGADRKWRIGFAVSTDPDLVNWNRYLGNPTVSPEGVGWERLHTETSFLEKRNDNHLKLYYQGFASRDDSQVGIAVSKTPILIDCYGEIKKRSCIEKRNCKP